MHPVVIGLLILGIAVFVFVLHRWLVGELLLYRDIAHCQLEEIRWYQHAIATAKDLEQLRAGVVVHKSTGNKLLDASIGQPIDEHPDHPEQD